MSGGRFRKRKWYSGELAKPLRPLFPNLSLLPPVACERDEADAWALVREWTRRHNAQTVGRGLTELLKKLIALADHFGIDISRPGWERDLVASLGKRHERALLFKGNGVAVSALFEKYNIDPGRERADLDLVLQLASAHVPAFRFAEPRRLKGRFSTLDFVGFVMAVAAVQEHLRQRGAKVSDRAVAAVLQNPKRLRTIISQRDADHVTRLLRTTGNDRRGHDAPLSDRAVRDYLRQITEARTAHREGRASTFQRQYIEEVVPTILHMADRAGVGQT
jgi:hypothetical protein